MHLLNALKVNERGVERYTVLPLDLDDLDVELIIQL